ncbi:MAG TPA: hypothetical protein VJ998_07455, partial [Pseudomonadales bacterium]|nr:hypothetical protein [Pseudomonadales bacterium]
ASLRAISAHWTMRIIRYADWTMDWSLAPDGNLYSSKAPGPVLLSAPLFVAVDKAYGALGGVTSRSAPPQPKPANFERVIICFVMQVVPLVILLVLVDRWFTANGYSKFASHFFVLATCFGSTTSIFYDNFFGHAFAANALLATLVAWLYGRDFVMGLFFGIAVLSEYSIALLLPGAMLLVLWRPGADRKGHVTAAGDFLLGGAAPAATFFTYNLIAFGGPLAIANLYQNPAFNLAHKPPGLSRLFSPGVHWHILGELLFGMSRGLVPTQPWIAVLLLLCLTPRAWRGNRVKPVFAFGLSGLALLLLMNSSYATWAGGLTAGPRFPSCILPIFAFMTATLVDRLDAFERAALFALLFAAIVLRSLIYMSTILAPKTNLWRYYVLQLLDRHALFHHLPPLILFWVALSCAAFGVWYLAHRPLPRRCRNLRRQWNSPGR